MGDMFDIIRSVRAGINRGRDDSMDTEGTSIYSNVYKPCPSLKYLQKQNKINLKNTRLIYSQKD